MKKSARSWLQLHRVEIALAIVFGLIGFLAGLGTRFDLQWQTRFDDEINAVQLLQLVVTVILAWLVTSILDKQKQAEKSAKEILLKRAEELHTFVTESAAKSSSGDFLYAEAAATTKRVSVATDRICRLLEANKIACDAAIRAGIVSQVDKLWELMTNTPVSDHNDTRQPAVRVEEGRLYFQPERALEIENAFEELKHSIMSLELAIINS
jgi:hypothetical protein